MNPVYKAIIILTVTLTVKNGKTKTTAHKENYVDIQRSSSSNNSNT